MAIKFSQFNLRTDHTSGMYLVGYDGNQNIHITVDNLFDDFINGTENTIAMFGTGGTVLADSILSQDAGATLLTVAGQLNVDAAATFDTSITVTGDSTLNGNVTLGDASTDLITQTGTLYLNGPIKDTTDTLGAVDQVLLSDATGELTFTDLADLHVGGAEVVEVPVKNVQGSALVKGDPVYISGSVGASGRLEVQLADASNTLKMPAVGLLKQDLADQAEGFAVVTGKLRNLITDPIDGATPTENDVIYVKPLGISGAALTTTKPVYGNFIQNIGKVGRVSTSNDGNLVVSSILRTNDIPNLTPGRLWVGSNGNTIESQTLFVDEANESLGIGTTTPDQNLTINGGTESFGLQVLESDRMTMGADADWNYIKGKNGNGFRFSTFGAGDVLTLTNAGNVGIGTISPSAKLQVEDVNAGGVLDALLLTNKSTTAGTSTKLKFVNSTDAASAPNTNYISSVRNAASDNDLIFGTSNSDRMTIDSSGNVGIGTTTPDARLSIDGGTDNLLATFKSTDDLAYISFQDDGTTSNTSVALGANDNNLVFFTGSSFGSEQMRIDSSGNVGIGTNLPGEKLSVSPDDNVSAEIGKLLIGNTGLSGYAGFKHRSLSSSTSYALLQSSTGETFLNASSTERINFRINNSDKMVLDTSGNVGIGDTSPSAKLVVVGEIRSDKTGNGVSFSSTGGGSSFTAFDVFTATNGGLLRLYDENGQTVNIDGRSAGGNTYFNNGGNVGIGTSSPGKNLHVYDSSGGATLKIESNTANAYDSSKIELIGGNLSTGEIIFGDPTDSDVGKIIYRHDGNSLAFNVNASEKMRIDSTGNVGVGTTSPKNTFAEKTLSVISSAANSQGMIEIGGNNTSDTFISGVSFTNEQSTDTSAFQRIAQIYAARDGANNKGRLEFNVHDGASLIAPMTIKSSGQLQLNEYGVGTFTGTAAKTLAVDASGNIIETAGVSVDGSGTANYVTKWLDTDTITDSVIYDDGTNVGIGTTNPGAKLEITASSGQEGIVINNSNGIQTFQLGHLASNDSYFQMKNNNNVTSVLFRTDGNINYINTGNIGIGTTSPNGARLHVVRAVSSTAINLTDTSTRASLKLKSSSSSDSQITFSQGTGATQIIQASNEAADTARDINLNPFGGNIGIGTISPTEKLDVSGNIALSGNIVDTNTNESIHIGVNDVWFEGKHTHSAFGVWARSPGNGQRKMGIDGGTSFMGLYTNATEKVRIDTNGNVGIGTTLPSFALDIGSSINSNEVFRINGAFSNVLFSGAAAAPTGGVGIWNFINTGTTAVTRFYVEDANNADDRLTFRFTGNQGSNEILAGTSSGNVGIGTTSPASKLDVNGGIRMADDSSTASASNVGTLRYRTSGNNSYVDMCMQTGASTYAWVNIVQNNW